MNVDAVATETVVEAESKHFLNSIQRCSSVQTGRFCHLKRVKAFRYKSTRLPTPNHQLIVEDDENISNSRDFESG